MEPLRPVSEWPQSVGGAKVAVKRGRLRISGIGERRDSEARQPSHFAHSPSLEGHRWREGVSRGPGKLEGAARSRFEERVLAGRAVIVQQENKRLHLMVRAGRMDAAHR